MTKMHDLAERLDSVTAIKSSSGQKPKSYYPSVTLRGVHDLGKHPVGKKLNFKVEGSIDRHTREMDEDGEKTRTEIKLHKIGIASVPVSGVPLMWCSACGTSAAGPFCPHCGEKMVKAKGKAPGKPRESEEDYDD